MSQIVSAGPLKKSAWKQLLDFNIAKELAFPLLFFMVYNFVVSYLHVDLQMKDFKISGMVYSILGLALGLLLVFRTNSAYERWWEGRRLLGVLTNNARALALRMTSMSSKKDEQTELARHLVVFVQGFRAYLRDESMSEHTPFLRDDERQELAKKQHQLNFWAKKLYQYVNYLKNEGRFGETLLFVFDGHVNAFYDVIGGCERIKRTPIPLAYSIHLRQFLYLYLFSLPFTMLHEMGYWSIPVNALVFYALSGLKKIGEEIEDPFGRDINDLPLDLICESISQNVCETVGITMGELNRPQGIKTAQ